MDSGDTAWLLTSAALVLLMTPGLALFYGGMTRAKSTLNMMMMVVAAMGTVTVSWVLWGYSLAFGEDLGGGLLGGFDALGLGSVVGSVSGTVPEPAFAAFQGMFAIITVALISGAIADRVRFGTWVVFTVVWLTVVYAPIGHWVWGPDGWIGALGAIDFAGGTVVHINSGAAALALALLLRPRLGWRHEPMRPHNLPMVLLGAGLLWFGWFGFNAGSALAADGTAGLTLLNTQVATATAVLGWLLVEKLRDGRPTTLGAASGVVAGLVAITPACSAVNPLGALLIGLCAGVACSLAVGLKTRLGYDDSLDVVGVHLVGGVVGALLIGVLATAAAPAGTDGLLFGGGLGQFGIQALAVVVTIAFSFVATYAIGWVLDKLMGWRVEAHAENDGIDLTEHAETAYDFATIAGGRPRGMVRGESPMNAHGRPVDAAAGTAVPADGVAIQAAEGVGDAGGDGGTRAYR